MPKWGWNPKRLVDVPGPETRSAWYLRRLFLADVRRLAPQVVRGLKEGVLPLWPAHGAEDLYEWEELEAATGGDLVRLRDAIMAWAARHHLECDWVYQTALLTVRWWAFERAKPDECRHPLSVDRLRWSYPGHQFFDEVMAVVEPMPGTWDPFSVTEEQYRQRVNAHIRAIKRRVRAAGYRQQSERRERRTTLKRRLQFLARHVVAGETYDEIANKMRRRTISPQAIQQAIRHVADEIGLPLPPRRGRPRRSS